jgi:hypothetical protein
MLALDNTDAVLGGRAAPSVVVSVKSLRRRLIENSSSPTTFVSRLGANV